MKTEPVGRQNAIIFFARAPLINRAVQSGPYGALPWEELDALFTASLTDLVEAGTRIADTDILLYRNPADFADEPLKPWNDRVKFHDLENSASGQLQAAVENAFNSQYSRLVIFLENNPCVGSAMLGKIFAQLCYEDDCFVVGPTVDGKCFLLGMKSNHSGILDQSDHRPLNKPNVLLERLCREDRMLFLTQQSFMLDSGSDLSRLRTELDAMDESDPDFPRRTHGIFKAFDKKYRIRKVTR